jgi:hypothetical protein
MPLYYLKNILQLEALASSQNKCKRLKTIKKKNKPRALKTQKHS